MSARVSERQFEIQDHNIAAGYVTYIVDIWNGDRDDPATSVDRYIGVWHEDDLETKEGIAFDPTFAGRLHRFDLKPRPLVWETVEGVKEADQQARRFRNDYDSLTEKDSDRWHQSYSLKQDQGLYEQFLDAIDRVAENEGDEEAWSIIDQWRSRQLRHEERI